MEINYILHLAGRPNGVSPIPELKEDAVSNLNKIPNRIFSFLCGTVLGGIAGGISGQYFSIQPIEFAPLNYSEEHYALKLLRDVHITTIKPINPAIPVGALVGCSIAWMVCRVITTASQNGINKAFIQRYNQIALGLQQLYEQNPLETSKITSLAADILQREAEIEREINRSKLVSIDPGMITQPVIDAARNILLKPKAAKELLASLEGVYETADQVESRLPV